MNHDHTGSEPLEEPVFFRKVMEAGNVRTPEATQRLVDATLGLLSARLTQDEGDDLRAQLPTFLKQRWDAHRHRKEHPTDVLKLDREEFIEQIRSSLGQESFEETERQVATVFHVLKEMVSAGEVRDVAAQLPRDLGALWESA